jgi:hypothetical protein
MDQNEIKGKLKQQIIVSTVMQIYNDGSCHIWIDAKKDDDRIAKGVLLSKEEMAGCTKLINFFVNFDK